MDWDAWIAKVLGKTLTGVNVNGQSSVDLLFEPGPIIVRVVNTEYSEEQPSFDLIYPPGATGWRMLDKKEEGGA